MTVRIAHDPEGRLILRLLCDGCERSAGSDFLTPAELCRLIGWNCDMGVVYCTECQARRYRRPRFGRPDGAPTALMRAARLRAERGA